VAENLAQKASCLPAWEEAVTVIEEAGEIMIKGISEYVYFSVKLVHHTEVSIFHRNL
jgi:hypothetical protein